MNRQLPSRWLWLLPILGLCACGGSAPDEEAHSAPSPDQPVQESASLSFPVGLGALQASGAAPIRIEVQEPNGIVREHRFSEWAARAQRDAAIEAAARYRLPDGTIPSEASGPNGEIVRPYRNGQPYQLRAPDGELLPVWWYPNAPRSHEMAEIDDDEARRRRAYGLALANARAGQEHDQKLITGGWVYYDHNFYGEGQQGLGVNSISRASVSTNLLGHPAVVFEIQQERQSDFEDYTNTHVGQALCLVLNGEIWCSPRLRSALRDSVQIEGGASGFSKAEARRLADLLQSGPR